MGMLLLERPNAIYKQVDKAMLDEKIGFGEVKSIEAEKRFVQYSWTCTIYFIFLKMQSTNRLGVVRR
jgi:hypothetical protein